jgi:O-antigen/teichoic acid export membrane protein
MPAPPVNLGQGIKKYSLTNTIWNLLADLLSLPAGMVIFLFLTRRMGPDGYGIYSIAFSLISWSEYAIIHFYNRAVIKLASSQDDWRPLGSSLLRQLSLVGVGLWLLWSFLAGPVSHLFGDPRLESYLRIYALDIPLTCLALAHRSLLIGSGGFQKTAYSTGASHLTRMVCCVTMVALGYGISGALAGNIACTAVELIVLRCNIRPGFFHADRLPFSRIREYALPIFISSIAMQLLMRLGLFSLKSLGGSASDAGYFSSAVNIAIMPVVLINSAAPLLLMSVSRMEQGRDLRGIQDVLRILLRGFAWALPLVLMVSGSSGPLVRFLLGSEYRPAASLLSVLIWGTYCFGVNGVLNVILTATDRIRMLLYATVPQLILAVPVYGVVVPRWGAHGAALVHVGFAVFGAIGAQVIIRHYWHTGIPLPTLLRSLLVSGLVLGLCRFWTTPSNLILVRLGLITTLVFASFWLMGEFRKRDIELLWNILGKPRWLLKRIEKMP